MRPILSPGLSETSAPSSSVFAPRRSVTWERRIMSVQLARRALYAGEGLSIRKARERGERCGEAGAFARRERLAQEKKAEQGGDHESHLRDRDHDARLGARHAFDHESEGKGENDRGPGRIAQRGAGRPAAAGPDPREDRGGR